jgi:hypothetical protein
MRNIPVRADQDQGKKIPDFLQTDQASTDPNPKSEVTLSSEEYKDAIKEAYKEGAKDALTENTPQHRTPAQKDGLSKDEQKINKEQREKDLTLQQKEGVQEGEKEAAKMEAQKREETKQKLQAIAERHDIELLRAKTVFPFSFFPDTIIIDTTKLTIIRKQMFATEHITTIPLKDIADAIVQTALFLGTLIVAYMPQASSPGMLKPVEDHITSLRREDAIRAKNIIKGILVANAEGIDIAKLEPDEIMNVIAKFGGSEGVT